MGKPTLASYLEHYQLPGFRTEYITESYVSSPPALFVIDEAGKVFTLGLRIQDRRDLPVGHYAFNVLADGFETGEYASFIERRNGKVRIRNGGSWKSWNGQSFT